MNWVEPLDEIHICIKEYAASVTILATSSYCILPSRPKLAIIKLHRDQPTLVVVVVIVGSAAFGQRAHKGIRDI